MSKGGQRRRKNEFGTFDDVLQVKCRCLLRCLFAFTEEVLVEQGAKGWIWNRNCSKKKKVMIPFIGAELTVYTRTC